MNIRIPSNNNQKEQNVFINLEQEFEQLEILSLKLSNDDLYPTHHANFGVVVGRVLLKNGLGVQNAKINIFIPITEEDKLRSEIVELYPFEDINDTYPNGTRYNLLPRTRNTLNPSHRAVGNMPDASDFTHYPAYVEVFEKYYKYTTTTNESGDYMIMGVPLGLQHIIMDFDVFDTQSFDLTANDLMEQQTMGGTIDDIIKYLDIDSDDSDTDKVSGFIYRGNRNYDVEPSVDLNTMPNIFSEVKQINVSPFWGDEDNYDIGITRCDFNIDFKYTPTAIFFGFLHAPIPLAEYAINYEYSIPSNDGLDVLGEDPTTGQKTGNIYPLRDINIVVYSLDDSLVMGSRKRVGVFKIKNSNGVFRISLPMYTDYYTMNEIGEMVPTKDTTIGLPTKGYYAFELYESEDSFGGRRKLLGGFNNELLPGVRIPATLTGDQWLGGWEGTWTGLFEYDLNDRRRRFYTISTSYFKHQEHNILLRGDDIIYFPKPAQSKSKLPWNFPLDRDSVKVVTEPEIIGSILIPRIQGFYMDSSEKYKTPDVVLQTTWLSAQQTYGVGVKDFEYYLGIGVQRDGGKNLGDVYSEMFESNDFVSSGGNLFGKYDTWNFGDNNTGDVFLPSYYAIELSNHPESLANEHNVHPPFNQAVSEQFTCGCFINCSTHNSKSPLFEVKLYDITNELQDLIKDGVYSSYKKNINVNTNKIRSGGQIGGQMGGQIYVEDLTINTQSLSSPNTYNGKYYYFGLWGSANALKSIEDNYIV